MDRSHTRFEKSGGSALLTLTRPENRNAITGPEMLSEIIGAIDDAESDPDVVVLLITGEGPAFSAGGNIKDMADRTGLFAGTPEEVTSPAELLPRARALAELIASKPAHSVRLAKRLLRHARSMDLDGFLELSAALHAISHHTDAHRRAVEKYLTDLKRQ